MSKIEFEIEGQGRDGQILVVCGWPNLCLADPPTSPVASSGMSLAALIGLYLAYRKFMKKRDCPKT